MPFPRFLHLEAKQSAQVPGRYIWKLIVLKSVQSQPDVCSPDIIYKSSWEYAEENTTKLQLQSWNVSIGAAQDWKMRVDGQQLKLGPWNCHC